MYDSALELNSPRNIIKNGSKSFALASAALPAGARMDVEGLYSWCRYCDDFIDGQLTPMIEDRTESLRELTFKAQDLPDDSVFLWPRFLIQKYGIANEHFEEFLLGMEMDPKHQGFSTLPELEVYCFRVAGVVGLLMSPIIGVENKEAEPHAVALGLAMQLTNICRDVKEDAGLGRVYIPRSLFPQASSLSEGINLLQQNPEFAHPAVQVLLARADELYEFGIRGLKFLPWRVAIAIGSAGYIYRSIGHRLLNLAAMDVHRTYNSRVVVGRGRKLWGLLIGLTWALCSRLPRVSASFDKACGRKKKPAFFDSLQGWRPPLKDGSNQPEGDAKDCTSNSPKKHIF